MHFGKTHKALLAVTASLVVCSAAQAQFEGLLKKVENVVKQVGQAQPAPQTATPAKSPTKAASTPAYMSKTDWDDLYAHSEDPAYLKKFEGRFAMITGEIAISMREYFVHTGDDYTGTSHFCKSQIGKLPTAGTVKIEAQLVSPYIEAGEDGSAIFLKNCRIADTPR